MDFDSDSWDACLSATSGRNHSRSDMYGEDTDAEDGLRPEYLCPFCAEEFDVVGLCCHVDEDHPVEAKSGVCPICAKRVGVEMVAHFTLQHGSLLKVQRKRRAHKRGSNSAYSAVRKELRGRDEHLLSSLNTEPDPLLSSFMYNLAIDDNSLRKEPHPPLKASLDEEATTEDSSKRNTQQAAQPDEDREEKARKCEFVQGLLLSTFLDDDL